MYAPPIPRLSLSKLRPEFVLPGLEQKSRMVLSISSLTFIVFCALRLLGLPLAENALHKANKGNKEFFVDERSAAFIPLHSNHLKGVSVCNKPFSQ